MRDQEVSKSHRLPDLQTALCVVGAGNHARAMGQSVFPGHCPPHFARGGRGLCGESV